MPDQQQQQQQQQQQADVIPNKIKFYRINSSSSASVAHVRFKDEDSRSHISITDSLFSSNSAGGGGGGKGHMRPVKFYCIRNRADSKEQPPLLFKSATSLSLNSSNSSPNMYFQPKQQVIEPSPKGAVKFVKPILKPTVAVAVPLVQSARTSRESAPLKLPEGLEDELEEDNDDDDEVDSDEDEDEFDESNKNIKLSTVTVTHFKNQQPSVEIEISSDEEERLTMMSVIKEDEEDMYYDAQSIQQSVHSTPEIGKKTVEPKQKSKEVHVKTALVAKKNDNKVKDTIESSEEEDDEDIETVSKGKVKVQTKAKNTNETKKDIKKEKNSKQPPKQGDTLKHTKSDNVKTIVVMKQVNAKPNETKVNAKSPNIESDEETSDDENDNENDYSDLKKKNNEIENIGINETNNENLMTKHQNIEPESESENESEEDENSEEDGVPVQQAKIDLEKKKLDVDNNKVSPKPNETKKNKLEPENVKPSESDLKREEIVLEKKLINETKPSVNKSHEEHEKAKTKLNESKHEIKPIKAVLADKNDTNTASDEEDEESDIEAISEKKDKLTDNINETKKDIKSMKPPQGGNNLKNTKSDNAKKVNQTSKNTKLDESDNESHNEEEKVKVNNNKREIRPVKAVLLDKIVDNKVEDTIQSKMISDKEENKEENIEVNVETKSKNAISKPSQADHFKSDNVEIINKNTKPGTDESDEETQQHEEEKVNKQEIDNKDVLVKPMSANKTSNESNEKSEHVTTQKEFNRKPENDNTVVSMKRARGKINEVKNDSTKDKVAKVEIENESDKSSKSTHDKTKGKNIKQVGLQADNENKKEERKSNDLKDKGNVDAVVVEQVDERRIERTNKTREEANNARSKEETLKKAYANKKDTPEEQKNETKKISTSVVLQHRNETNFPEATENTKNSNNKVKETSVDLNKSEVEIPNENGVVNVKVKKIKVKKVKKSIETTNTDESTQNPISSEEKPVDFDPLNAKSQSVDGEVDTNQLENVTKQKKIKKKITKVVEDNHESAEKASENREIKNTDNQEVENETNKPKLVRKRNVSKEKSVVVANQDNEQEPVLTATNTQDEIKASHEEPKLVRRKIVLKQRPVIAANQNDEQNKKPVEVNKAPILIAANSQDEIKVSKEENTVKKTQLRSRRAVKNDDVLNDNSEIQFKNTQDGETKDLQLKKVKKKRLASLNDSLERDKDKTERLESEFRATSLLFDDKPPIGLKRSNTIAANETPSTMKPRKPSSDIKNTKSKNSVNQSSFESSSVIENKKQNPIIGQTSLKLNLKKLEFDNDEEENISDFNKELHQNKRAQLPNIKRQTASPIKPLRKTQSFMNLHDEPQSGGREESVLSKSVEFNSDSSREAFGKMIKPKIFKKNSNNKSGEDFESKSRQSFQGEKSYLLFTEEFSDDERNSAISAQLGNRSPMKKESSNERRSSSKEKLFEQRIHMFSGRTRDASLENMLKLPNIRHHSSSFRIESANNQPKSAAPTNEQLTSAFRDRFFSKSNLSSFKSSTKEPLRASNQYNSKSVDVFESSKPNKNKSSAFKSESSNNFGGKSLNSSQKQFNSQMLNQLNSDSSIIESLSNSPTYLKRCQHNHNKDDKFEANRFYLYDYWYENKEVLYATNYMIKECKVCAGFYAYNPSSSSNDEQNTPSTSAKTKQTSKHKTPWNSRF